MSNIQPKKQDLDGVEYLSANESTNIKISGDDSSSSGARIELGKDLTTAPIISHLSGDGFDFGVLGNFTFPQMILSKQKLQAVVTPLPATDTLKINKKILLDDGAGNTGTLDINGTDLEISSSGNQLLGGVVTIDTTNNRVGINVPNPTEDFEIDGNIQMNTGATSKIVFYDTPNAHEHGEIDADGELTDGGVIKFQTKVDGGSVTEKLRINNAGALGIGGANYGGTNQVIVSQGSINPPTWKNNYPNIVSGFPIPPPAPLYGDQILFNFTGSGNIGAYMPMIWNGATWKVIGSTILCRWFCGSASQIITTTTHANITIGDYGTRTFTPPFTGYYEIGQNWFKWELNSGIGMSVYFSATDNSEHYRLYYTEDWNGPYQHWRAGVSCPFIALLQSTKTYRFTANLSYASGNQGTLLASGNTAYVKAIAS